ncbi:hypothetical protein BH23PLA1_BH23PLA1_25370 [soil metagenome]
MMIFWSSIEHPRFSALRYVSLSLALVLLGGGASGQETELKTVEKQLETIAEKLAEYLETSKYGQTVSVGRFGCPPQLGANAGPGMVKLLHEELERHGIKVQRVAKFGVEGEYTLLEEHPGTGVPAARITAKLVDRSGTVTTQVERYVEYVEKVQDIAVLFGATAEVKYEHGEPDPLMVLHERIVKPRVDVRMTKVAATPESAYAVEILIAEGDDYSPRSPENQDGLAFVPIRRDEIYAIRLINDSGQDAAVTLSIDGLNMFAFSENRHYRYVIVPAESQGVIKGWHRTNQVTDAFKVTEFAGSAVAELGADDADLGVITVAFSQAWPKDSPPPRELQQMLARRNERLATGRGPSIEQRFEVVERLVGPLQTVISIRYTRD